MLMDSLLKLENFHYLPIPVFPLPPLAPPKSHQLDVADRRLSISLCW